MLILSVDLGKVGDYTAVALIETKPEAYHIRHLQRLPLHTDYTTQVYVVAQLVALIRNQEQADPVLVVDGTGVGAPVVDMFRKCGMRPIAITITSGSHVSPDTGLSGAGFCVPKQDLIGALAVALQGNILKVSPKIPDSKAFLIELQNFKFRVTGSGNASFNAEGKDHDDLLMAVAMGIWYAGRHRERKKDHVWAVSGGRRVPSAKWDR
jgi:hypothetical protein